MAKQPGFLKRGETLRLQAFLSRSGMASRRGAEEMIEHGRVKVNGAEVTAQGTKVVAGVDRVEVDGVEVKVAPTTWIALHKPKGYVTTRQDPYGRQTVYELLPDKYHGLFHVGRLDRDSEGLLLLTNEGDLANRFLHPSFGITKEYDVVATGKPTDAALRQLVEGVELEDGIAQAESARLIGPAGNGMSRLKLVLREGKKREVRRMLEAVGHPVKRLVRRTFGPIELGELPEGKWRVVAPEELAHVRDAKAMPKKKRPAATEEADRPKEKAARTRPSAAGGEARPTRAKAERPARGAREEGPRASRGRTDREERPARGRAPERGAPRGRGPDRDEPPPRERAPVHIDWDAENWGDERPSRGSRPGPSRGAADRPADRPVRGDRARPAAGRGASDRPGGDDRPRRPFQDRGDRPARGGAGSRPPRLDRDQPPARGARPGPGRRPADDDDEEDFVAERRPRSSGPGRGGAAPRGGAPARAGDRPAGGRPGGKPSGDRPAGGRPGGKPSGDRPAGGRPGGKPSGGKPAGGRPGGKPAGGRPGPKPPAGGRRPGQGGGGKRG